MQRQSKKGTLTETQFNKGYTEWYESVKRGKGCVKITKWDDKRYCVSGHVGKAIFEEVFDNVIKARRFARKIGKLNPNY